MSKHDALAHGDPCECDLVDTPKGILGKIGPNCREKITITDLHDKIGEIVDWALASKIAPVDVIHRLTLAAQHLRKAMEEA